VSDDDPPQADGNRTENSDGTTNDTGAATSAGSDEPAADTAPFRGGNLDEATAEAIVDDADTDEAGPFSSVRESPDDEPEPEVALSQPLVDEGAPRRVEPSELREVYGYVRTYFKTRPNRYRGLQRRLKQARIPDTYDEYLTRSAQFALLGAVATALAGLGLTTGLALTNGAGAALEATSLFAGETGAALLARPLLVLTVAGTVLGPAMVGTTVWLGRNYYYPRTVVAARRRRIALTMPYAVAFMYALSSGGMNFVEVCRRLADAEGAYGEVSREFDAVVREIDLFGNDIRGALSNVRTLTPSENLQRFLDDLLGVIESGGDLEAFLEGETEARLDDAIEEQTGFIETLGLLSEVFVAGFVAAPLFVIVVLMVVGFIGSQTVDTIALLVYVVFPLSMLGFLLLIDVLSQPFDEPAVRLVREERRTMAADDVANDTRFEGYRRSKQTTALRSAFDAPFDAIRHEPRLSLALTVPAAVLVVAAVIAGGFATPTIEGVLAAPLETTVGLAVVPVLVATGPLAILHERERRRAREIAERFPDVLGILASANQMGVDLVDGFDLVTRWASGRLATELGRTRNDIAWNHDVTGALLSLADRLDVPQLTRTMVLIAEGSRSTGDLHDLLEIAAIDTRARAKLTRERRQEVGSYVAIVVLGFLVYLFVIVMIAASFFGPITEQTAAAGATGTESPIDLASIPVETYQTLFLHSALVQGFGSGLLAGKLAENDAVSGLKYSLPLVIVTVVAFALFV